MIIITRTLELLRKFIFFVFIIVVGIFASSFIFHSYLPIPSDTIVSLYHPFRDLYAETYPRGVSYKNPLITDPVRQLYPWKYEVIKQLASFHLPLWNPYEMAGKPLLANFQSSPFYIFNLILFMKPFAFAWTIFVYLQVLLLGIFMYLYLRNVGLSKFASYLGTMTFAFSGFSMAWFEWGTIVHTAMWLPLILLSVDKMFYYSQVKDNSETRLHLLRTINSKKDFIWFLIFIISLSNSFFAGHLQTFFYLLIFVVVYIIARWHSVKAPLHVLFTFIIYFVLFGLITAIQWIPTFQFINLSARSFDQIDWMKAGWFVPWQHLVQIVVPDFFGNPATDNYWGVWNYGELVGFVGVVAFFFVLYAVVARHDKKTLFYSAVLICALIFALPTPFAQLPYVYNIPFLSTAQPTRLLFIVCFCLSVLASFGFDYLEIKQSSRKIVISTFILASIFILIWLIVFLNQTILDKNIVTARRNLIIPSVIFLFIVFTLFIISRVKNLTVRKLLLFSYLIVSSFELLRFGMKFNSFTPASFLFPSTRALEFLQKQDGVFRIATNNPEMFPPNFSTIYHLQSIDGYDPLYTLSYAEFITSLQRNKPDRRPPFGFNRIITPRRIDSPLFNILNVKYVLSLIPLNVPQYVKVFEEGKTMIYENKDVLPRAFFASSIKRYTNSYAVLQDLFLKDLSTTALVLSTSSDASLPDSVTGGKASIKKYEDNNITIETENISTGFLILTDNYYPTWHATIDGIQTPIYRTDYTFRGIVVPAGKHVITWYPTIW